MGGKEGKNEEEREGKREERTHGGMKGGRKGMDGREDGGRKSRKRPCLITLLRSGMVYSFSLTSHMTNSPTSGTKCSLLLH